MSSLLPNAPSLSLGTVHVSTFEVRTTTIDIFCKGHGIKQVDVLKVDAEGYDLTIIRGATHMLATGRIKFVYVEFSSVLRRGDDQSGALYPLAEFLLRYGLQFIASYTEQVGMKPSFWLVSNALFALPPQGPLPRT
jgi:Methyltransferase FkbM domain